MEGDSGGRGDVGVCGEIGASEDDLYRKEERGGVRTLDNANRRPPKSPGGYDHH